MPENKNNNKQNKTNDTESPMGFFLKRCVALMLVFTVMPGGEMASAATAGVEMTADQKQNQNGGKSQKNKKAARKKSSGKPRRRRKVSASRRRRARLLRCPQASRSDCAGDKAYTGAD